MKILSNIKLRTVMVTFVAAFALVGVVATPGVYADVNDDDITNKTLSDGASSAKGNGQQSSLFGDQGIFKAITNTLLYIVGAISVIMLVIGGVRYTTSNGDAKNVEAAKNTILYAIIGIVVALLAFAIVNFVLVNIGTGDAAT